MPAAELPSQALAGMSVARVELVETLHCDAGWRNYHFVKLQTDDGVVGWSEYDEHQGAFGVTTVIERLGKMVVGMPEANGPYSSAKGLRSSAYRIASSGTVYLRRWSLPI